MLIAVLYIIAFGGSAYGIYLNLRYDKKRFNRRALLILFCGMLYLLTGYIVLIEYPQHLYRSIAFPVSMLYGAVLLFVFNGSVERRMEKKGLHMLPFSVAFSLYMLLLFYPSWRYYIYHEYYVGVHMLSSALLITYALGIGLRSHSNNDYSLKRFVKAEKKTLIPFSVLVLVVGLMVVIVAKRGEMETYLMFNLILFILLLLPIIQWSLLTIKEKRKEDESAETKILTTIPRNLELSYKTEIEKFIASKAYLDIDLNRSKFCELLNIPKSHVSPFLKQVYDKNYNGFINELRISYAARQLRRPELVYTIDDLSFICGFRSRASFYRNFIAVFGCSPHQYRAKQLKKTEA